MLAKLKTWDILKEEGFKHDWNQCYAGDKRNPDAKFPSAWIHTYLGKEVKIVNIDKDDGTIEFQGEKKVLKGYYWLFEDEEILKKRFNRPIEFKLRGFDKPVRIYPGVSVSIPYKYEELNVQQALKLGKFLVKNCKV